MTNPTFDYIHGDDRAAYYRRLTTWHKGMSAATDLVLVTILIGPVCSLALYATLRLMGLDAIPSGVVAGAASIMLLAGVHEFFVKRPMRRDVADARRLDLPIELLKLWYEVRGDTHFTAQEEYDHLERALQFWQANRGKVDWTNKLSQLKTTLEQAVVGRRGMMQLRRG